MFERVDLELSPSEGPERDAVFSVSLGVRYQTVAGPIRAECGYNLKRRPGDPAGTFHFSIGFRF